VDEVLVHKLKVPDVRHEKVWDRLSKLLFVILGGLEGPMLLSVGLEKGAGQVSSSQSEGDGLRQQS
jgi:hypothetical protein